MIRQQIYSEKNNMSNNPNNATGLIYRFLENFKYLDQNGKRAKSFGNAITSIFYNKKLTAEIENQANLLIKNLEELKQKTISEGAKFEAFISLVTTSLNVVRQCRVDLGPVNFENDDTFESAGSFSSYSWNIKRTGYRAPYDKGKFEKNIIAGLKAVGLSADDAQQKKISDVTNNAKAPIPKKVFY